MFWLWVGLVLVVVLALAAWSTVRAKRVHGTTGVADDGAFGGPRETLGEADAAKAQAESQTFRPDRHVGGSF